MFGWFTALKLGWKILIIAALFAAIGGTIYAGYRYVQNKDDKIESLQKDISTLKENQVKLTQSNDSLSSERQRLLDEAEQNRAQLQQQMDLINKAQQQIAKYDQYLFSDDRKQTKISENKADPEKALAASNAQQKCFWENYNKFNGHCVDGVFVEGN